MHFRPKVSGSVPKSVLDSEDTLDRDFWDTPEAAARRAPETLCGTLPRNTPVFRDTLGLGETPGTLLARRAQETLVAGREVRESKSRLAPRYLGSSQYQGVSGGDLDPGQGRGMSGNRRFDLQCCLKG